MERAVLSNYLINGKPDIDKMLDDFYGYIYIVVKNGVTRHITEEDIEETGVVVENPVIGHIPSRQEIVNELEELLMTM